MTLDQALAGFAATVSGQPVVLGTRDCGTLVRDVLYEQGIDVTGEYWTSPLGAGRVLLRHGRGFAPWLAALGLEEIPPLFAQAGDIVVFRETHAAPVVGPHVLIAEHDGVVAPVLLAEAVWASGDGVTAWRVPRG
jgi:hypothetical protein